MIWASRLVHGNELCLPRRHWQVPDAAARPPGRDTQDNVWKPSQYEQSHIPSLRAGALRAPLSSVPLARDEIGEPKMTIDPPREFPAFFLHGQMYVHIIESPSPADLLGGRTEGQVLRESLKLAGIPTSYNLATDRATFESAMGQRVYEAVKVFEAYPILHFSMHGNEQGLEMTNGDFLAWQELAGNIRGLEPKPRSGVIVSMSACYGAFARQMAMALQSPPYSRLVGHPGNLDWADAAVAFTALYHRLLIKNCLVSQRFPLPEAALENLQERVVARCSILRNRLER